MESTREYERTIPNSPAAHAYVNSAVTEPTSDNNHEAIALEPIDRYESIRRDYDMPQPYESLKRAEKTPSRCSTKTTVFLVIIVLIVLGAAGFVGYYFINKSSSSRIKDDKSNPPIISNCPQDIIRQLPANQTFIKITWDEPTATDDVTLTSQLTQTQTKSPGQEFEIGVTDVIYTFTDDGGRTSVCSFNIILSTTGGFALTCPPDQVIQSPMVAPVAVFFDVGLTQVTGRNQPVGAPVATPSSGSVFSCAGNVQCSNPVVVTVTDASNVQAQCTFNVVIQDATVNNVRVQVYDTVPPVTTCPNNIVLTNTNPTTTLPECTGFNGGGLGYVYFVRNVNQNTAAVFNTGTNQFQIGVTTVRCETMDSAGNTGSCIFTVTVNVPGIPLPTVINCPTQPADPLMPIASVQAAAGATSAVVTFVDPSAGTSPVMTNNGLNSGSSFPLGLTEIVYTFGTAGAQTTCIVFVFVTESMENNCASSPCMPGVQCFYSKGVFVCDQRRRRRDAMDLGCDPSCASQGGICVIPEGYFEPSCFLSAIDQKPFEYHYGGTGLGNPRK